MILSIDTSTPFLVLGLWDGQSGAALALEDIKEVGRAHAEELPQAVTRLYQQSGRPPGATVLAIGTGPGSYTGLRVGTSYALGCARAWNADVVGVSSLEGVAARAQGTVAVSADARRGQVYGAVYQVHEGLVTEVLDPPRKQPTDEFASLARGLTWLRDEAPSGIALARLAAARGQPHWQLEYS
ncbi:tRNA (adenosine(37)-N6)-threonylcarbamoyltransferase complex dimerization subunit type 1 TsaB [Deinococcus peraridilitoris]|uniref:Universal bacterial protein YeaZ n=1 Tax=Deinococcus peraridilitoris (strain DSM 19664 / LMG 22246 / CIP 109416 / KR-200) TaxID=937777 RepID=L0A6Y1_DEIPD|nr:tRNA (adenosine(37)-N6)-threonylcarbamoyltransferase complex dimerization subunit type 1 TsaB [Deinococcus peraridilitoris]AFZ68952.1 universal bacterial protein YeaZ [Deinococcus peraridilitoris DSM 19664]